MAGLVPAIHAAKLAHNVWKRGSLLGVDTRHKAGHDGRGRNYCGVTTTEISASLALEI